MKRNKAVDLVLGLGSNKGDRLLFLQKAIKEIEKELGPISKLSTVIETKAWGNTEQGDFLNQVIVVKTSRFPLEILRTCKRIEALLGRTESIKWGPREIDIDLLFFENHTFTFSNLIVPHPFIKDREFVITSLKELGLL